jgi:hypothetical protein
MNIAMHIFLTCLACVILLMLKGCSGEKDKTTTGGLRCLVHPPLRQLQESFCLGA